MGKFRNITIIFLLAIGLLTSVGQAKSPGLLLQEGLYAEQTEGDLDKAIEIYGQVIAEAGPSQQAAARATYQLGMCYLKKGEEAKAAEYFQDVISTFSKQDRLVRKAQAQLAKISPPVADSAPMVVSTTPENYAGDVSAELDEISVTFDQKMTDGSWSWVQWIYTYPETVGNPYYDREKKTCTLRVKLKPGEAYFVVINHEPYVSFKNVQGVSAQPYVMVFATKDENGNPTPIPEVMLAKAREVNSAKSQELYTQELNAEINPDGTINFRTTVRVMNEGDSPITTTSFVNSDFVKVTAMYDDKDRPMDFTTTHENRHYRYHLTFNEPILPGETMDYSHEGTMTGLIKAVPGAEDTFAYYMRHFPSAGRPTLRIETFLLPEGAELRSSSPSHMQRREKDGRIELHVQEMIPDGGSLTTAFEYRLAGGTVAAAKTLELNPAPWVDGEIMELRLKLPAGNEYGAIIHSAQKGTSGQKDIWLVASYMHVTRGNLQQYTLVEAERESFAPVFAQTKNWMGNYIAGFEEGKIHLETDTAGKKSSKDVVVDGIHYDNEQVLYLIRRMPLAEGYSSSFPIFTLQGGVAVECRIEVIGTEEVTVEAGTFEFYKTNLSIYSSGIRALLHTLWFSADEHQYLVKYDVGGAATMELTKVTQMEKNRPLTFEDEGLGFSVTIPADWRFYRHGETDIHQGYLEGAHLLQLIAPELKAWSVFVCKKTEADSAKEVAEENAETLKGSFKNYVIQPDSWIEVEIAGLRGVQYVADYEKEGTGLVKYAEPKEMVEYRTYILGESMVYWFVFRLEKDKLEEIKAELNSIVNSLKL